MLSCFFVKSSFCVVDSFIPLYVYQGTDSIVTGSIAPAPSGDYDWSKSFCCLMNRSYLFVCESSNVPDNFSGYISYDDNKHIYNHTNATFKVFYENGAHTSWYAWNDLAPGGSMSLTFTFYDSLQPFSYVGDDINISYEGSSNIVFPR